MSKSTIESEKQTNKQKKAQKIKQNKTQHSWFLSQSCIKNKQTKTETQHNKTKQQLNLWALRITGVVYVVVD